MASNSFGLPRQHLVREPLEGLAEHREAAVHGIPRAEVKVAEPALAAAVSPFGREDHQVEGARLLHLEPALAARSGRVRRVHGFRHHALVTAFEGLANKRIRLCAVGRYDVRDLSGTADSRELGKTAILRLIEQSPLSRYRASNQNG